MPKRARSSQIIGSHTWPGSNQALTVRDVRVPASSHELKIINISYRIILNKTVEVEHILARDPFVTAMTEFSLSPEIGDDEIVLPSYRTFRENWVGRDVVVTLLPTWKYFLVFYTDLLNQA